MARRTVANKESLPLNTQSSFDFVIPLYVIGAAVLDLNARPISIEASRDNPAAISAITLLAGIGLRQRRTWVSIAQRGGARYELPNHIDKQQYS